MDWSSDYIQSMFGQIIGDPTYRLEYIWVEENGICCRNTVSKDSRRNGAICLKTFQELLVGNSPTLRLSKAASYMLCADVIPLGPGSVPNYGCICFTLKPIKLREPYQFSNMTITTIYWHIAGQLVRPTALVEPNAFYQRLCLVM